MVILGIYLEDGEKNATRNLDFTLNKWFPFGNIPNIHDILHNNKDGLEKFKETIKNNQSFINKLYNSLNPKKDNDFNLNISCIVGKNGSGKSTLLSLYYRIINNFNCKINQLYPDLNEHKTEWAYGFNAILYYKLEDEIFSIKIYDNVKNDNLDYQKLPVQFLDEKGNDYFNNSSNRLDKEFYAYLREKFFYTISENYSIYPTTFSNFGVDNNISNESWEDKLYHKNDGYLTPLVLVPFKDENMIDIGKETKLAAERVTTLSLQLLLNKSSFIEDYEPEYIYYKLINRKNYAEKLKEKLNDSYKYYLNRKEKEGTNINNKKFLISKVENIIDTLYSSSKTIWENLLSFDDFKNTIKQYILDYLSYKSIKTIFNYQHFWKEYCNNKCIYEYLMDNNYSKAQIDELIFKIISNEFNTTNINHMNLKIVQCLNYINNKNFPKRLQKDFHISMNEFKNFLSQQKDNYSYDDVFINMLPSIFNTEVLFKKTIKNSDGSSEYLHKIQLSTMSSGEQQLLFALSYIIYHIKNIESINDENRTTYENISLIIDEAELYLHPDFQRKYLSELIKILKRSQLNNIKNINIIIATHSPFIISDIPYFNIMGLEDGKTRAFDKATLGANIYDLFKKQFFMTSSLGKISCDLFNEIISDYYTFQDNLNEKGDKIKIQDLYTKYINKIEDYKNLISHIGDDYYQRTIGKMIFRICKMNENEIYKELKKLCVE